MFKHTIDKLVTMGMNPDERSPVKMLQFLMEKFEELHTATYSTDRVIVDKIIAMGMNPQEKDPNKMLEFIVAKFDEMQDRVGTQVE